MSVTDLDRERERLAAERENGAGRSIADRAGDVSADPQDSLFDVVVEDNEALLGALEEREKLKERLAALRKQYEGADARAKSMIGELALEPEQQARIGRFKARLSKVKPKDVSFKTAATTQLRIGVIRD